MYYFIVGPYSLGVCKIYYSHLILEVCNLSLPLKRNKGFNNMWMKGDQVNNRLPEYS